MAVIQIDYRLFESIEASGSSQEAQQVLAAALTDSAEQMLRWRRYIAQCIRHVPASMNAADGGALIRTLMEMQELADRTNTLASRLKK